MMNINELIEELGHLKRHEKWQVIQKLMNDLAQEEQTPILLATEYDVWSPYDSATAANQLQKLLDDE